MEHRSEGFKQTERYHIRATLRALDVLEAFSAERPTLSLTEVGQAIGLNASTTFRLLATLESAGTWSRTRVLGATVWGCRPSAQQHIPCASQHPRAGLSVPGATARQVPRNGSPDSSRPAPHGGHLLGETGGASAHRVDEFEGGREVAGLLHGRWEGVAGLSGFTRCEIVFLKE